MRTVALAALALGLVAAIPASAQPNTPPVPVGIADGDVVETSYGVAVSITFSFRSPESGQTTTITFDDPDGVVLSDALTPGNPATGELTFRVLAGTNTRSGTTSNVDITACDDATDAVGNDISECTTVAVTLRILDPPVVPCSPAAPISIVGYDADGVGSGFGEHVEFFSGSAMGETPPRIDFSTCTLLVFDPFDEVVTFAYTPTVIANVFQDIFFTAGDPGIPVGFLPDGPGAFALVEGSFGVGAGVGDVLGSVVAALVYLEDGSEFGRVESPVTAASLAAFAEALAQLGGAVTGDDDGALDLALVAAPNPLSGSGSVSFGLAEASDVRVAMYDALGREVAMLAEGPYGVGRHTVGLTASSFPAGVYVIRVVTGADAQTTRVTVVR